MEPSEQWSFERLLHPVAAETFFNTHFETSPLHVGRSEHTFYESLLTLDEVDRVLTTLHLSHPSVTMVDALKPIEPTDYTFPSGLIDTARLFQAYANGGTIVLHNLESSLPSLMELCRSMEAELSARFQCNIYLTPGGAAQGLAAHYDSHDVFVLQVSGTKRWRIYDMTLERPLRGQAFSPEAHATGPLTMELVLEPGDLLYLPRGLMHEASTTDTASCHITLGLLPTTWTDLLLEVVAQVALEDAELRRSLPPGHARPGFDREEARCTFRALLTRVLEKADFDAALDHFIDDLVSTRHPLLRGQLGQVERLCRLTLDDRARSRPNLLYRLHRTGDHVTLSAYGTRITLPSHAAESLEHALTQEQFRIGDLPGELDDAGKLVLVERLVREGLVQLL